MRAASVTVVVLCVCVSTHTCRLARWNHKTDIPTDSSQYRDRFKFLPIFLKMLRSKVMAYYAYIPRAAPASLSFFPHEISFYASVKPITTFSLHRQVACGRQRAIRWHRFVKRHSTYIRGRPARFFFEPLSTQI